MRGFNSRSLTSQQNNTVKKIYFKFHFKNLLVDTSSNVANLWALALLLRVWRCCCGVALVTSFILNATQRLGRPWTSQVIKCWKFGALVLYNLGIWIQHFYCIKTYVVYTDVLNQNTVKKWPPLKCRFQLKSKKCGTFFWLLILHSKII